MIARRRSAVTARREWVTGRWAPLAWLAASQPVMAARYPAADRMVELLGLLPGMRYVDVGCGTANLAGLLAARAGMSEPPLHFDVAAPSIPIPGEPAPTALAWPEHLPLRDGSVDALTAIGYVRRFEDEVVHGFAGEIARVLAAGGVALIVDVAPVRSELLNRFHTWVFSAGIEAVDLRGWGRMASVCTGAGIDEIRRVDLGPWLLPPVPRVAVLLRRRSEE